MPALSYHVPSIWGLTSITEAYIWISDCQMLKPIPKKSHRRQCDALNTNNKSGHKEFIVISGKLMQRNAAGQLQAYSIPQTSNTDPLPSTQLAK